MPFKLAYFTINLVEKRSFPLAKTEHLCGLGIGYWILGIAWCVYLRSLSAVRRLPSAVCRLPSAVCCPPSAVCRPPSAVRHPPSAVRRAIDEIGRRGYNFADRDGRHGQELRVPPGRLSR
jgi:hypothetical protein